MIERWELLQAQDLSKEMRTKQNEQQWQQLNSDLNKILTWLGETEEELEQQRRLELGTDIQTIELRIKKLKVQVFLVVKSLFLTFLLLCLLFSYLNTYKYLLYSLYSCCFLVLTSNWEFFALLVRHHGHACLSTGAAEGV